MARLTLVGGFGAVVSFVAVVDTALEVPLEFLAVALTVIVPSAKTWPLMPVKWTSPAPVVPVVVC